MWTNVYLYILLSYFNVYIKIYSEKWKSQSKQNETERQKQRDKARKTEKQKHDWFKWHKMWKVKRIVEMTRKYTTAFLHHEKWFFVFRIWYYRSREGEREWLLFIWAFERARAAIVQLQPTAIVYRTFICSVCMSQILKSSEKNVHKT